MPESNPTTPNQPVIGRLAPSPTGFLHVGHARSFLAAWWSARVQGGEVVLRIEDLDGGRCRPEYVDAARRDLEWLGLDWDAELVQSSDLQPYERAVERLLAQGDAFPCVCSRREIEAALSAPHGRRGELSYPGTCRGRFATVEEAEGEGEGESKVPVGVRFRVPSGRYTIDDAFVGRFEAEPASECGDFLLLRRDGAVAYQLAVVVDDGRQGITEVVRGDDLLPSAVRQTLLQGALGLPHPRWIHLPLVVDPSGRRLAKRDEDLFLSSLRESGLDSRVLVSFAARSLCMPDAASRLSAAERTVSFDWVRVPREPAVFDPLSLGL